MPLNQREEEELRDEIRNAREMIEQRQLPGNFTDLDALVVGQSDPRVISMALMSSALRNTLDAQDDAGMTALMYAAKELKGDIARQLAEAGANKALKSKDGQTALDLFNEAYNADQESMDADAADWFRGLIRGGRRRKTRRWKLPRKMSRAYCRKTSCRRMGFTQRASCRPYKNCYRR